MSTSEIPDDKPAAPLLGLGLGEGLARRNDKEN